MEANLLGPLSLELGNADFGDRRLTRRLGLIADLIATAPSCGLPKAMRTESAREAAYRFMSNPNVTPARILAPHFDRTCARAVDEEVVLAIHDTTEFGFGGTSRASVGRTNNSEPGFFAHVALAVRPDRRPLGLLGVHTWARTQPAAPRATRLTTEWINRADKESNRWRELVTEVEDRVAPGTRVVHVMDREADQYTLFDEIVNLESHFVIRATHDRILEEPVGEAARLKGAARALPALFRREVPLHKRTRKYKNVSINRPREARHATLTVSATSLTLRRTRIKRTVGAAESIELNVVRVSEVDPPADLEAVEWILLTNLPVASVEDVEVVIDFYRARWVIEEFFKAVKTGCNYEKLQLESYDALANALAVVLPIACQMLLLRTLARTDEAAPATIAVSEQQLEVLRATPWVTLPAKPTVRDAYGEPRAEVDSRPVEKWIG